MDSLEKMRKPIVDPGGTELVAICTSLQSLEALHFVTEWEQCDAQMGRADGGRGEVDGRFSRARLHAVGAVCKEVSFTRPQTSADVLFCRGDFDFA